ncbi:hypothetical protein R1flu_019013 [Riccia fluitans]|uniref:F-box domain-containing protein n=1 Tax=Riccia fluitans TaxID=41844 RepID=A0ABD1ZIY3_9MARC
MRRGMNRTFLQEGLRVDEEAKKLSPDLRLGKIVAVAEATGGPTVKVQVPHLCSLQALKDAVSPLISLPPLNFSLSLNKKDPIDGPGTVPLSTFGITSGDLLYYLVASGNGSVPSRAASSSRQFSALEASSAREGLKSREAIGSPSTQNVTNFPANASEALDKASLRELCASAASRRATLTQPITSSESEECSRAVTPTCHAATSPMENSQNAESPNVEETAEVMTGSAEFDSFIGRRLPIPDLLQRVLSSEEGNVKQASSYLILAVHAVMLETGFIRVDLGGSAAQGTKLPAGWSSAGHVNLVYSLPEVLLSNKLEPGRKLGEEALLRCQIVGNALVIYGAVTGGSVHRLSLSVKTFLLEDMVSRSTNGGSVETEITSSYVRKKECVCVFRDIFELWKDVKDALSLPLLTVMCEKAGLPPPPSLLRLPTELKIKVLEALPATALASVACVSSELRFLTANEEFWKQQYRKEFGSTGERAPGGRGWKNAFVRDWEHRRRREEERREAERYFRNDIFPPGTILRTPPYAPHFGGLDFFQGMGSQGGFGGVGPDGGNGFRNYGFRGGLVGNPAPVPGIDPGFGTHREEASCFPHMQVYADGMVFDGEGLRTWPSPTSLPARGTRALGAPGSSRGLPMSRYNGEEGAGMFFGQAHIANLVNLVE